MLGEGYSSRQLPATAVVFYSFLHFSMFLDCYILILDISTLFLPEQCSAAA
jgi:hypothetical protein